MNLKPTRGFACLDNIFTNANLAHVTCHVTAFPFSDHDCVWVSLHNLVSTHEGKPQDNIVISRPVTNENMDYFINTLSSIDWSKHLNIDEPSDIDSLFENFFKVFQHNFDMCVPRRKCKVNNCKGKIKSQNKPSNVNSWYTPQLLNMKNIMLLHLDIYRRDQTETSRLAYLNIRRRYKNTVNEAKKSYNLSKIESSGNKCKKAWSIIQAINKKTLFFCHLMG